MGEIGRGSDGILFQEKETIEKISKSEIKIGIEAPGDVTINREEVPKDVFGTSSLHSSFPRSTSVLSIFNPLSHFPKKPLSNFLTVFFLGLILRTGRTQP